MQGFKKFEVDTFTYNDLKKIQIKNGSNIKEQHIGSRKKLYSKECLLATTANNSQLELNGISIQKFNSFIGMFNKNLYSQLLKNQELFDLKIKYKGLAREKNLDLWNKLENETFFYNVDLSSAYWQIAYSLGYISETIFKKYMHLDEYKTLKRYCISFLARKNKMVYTDNNNLSYTITCDNSVLQNIYDNIRNQLYSNIQDVRNNCENWIEYNIDGITVLNHELKIVKKQLKQMNLFYKITECVKINEKEYLHGNKIRKFRK